MANLAGRAIQPAARRIEAEIDRPFFALPALGGDAVSAENEPQDKTQCKGVLVNWPPAIQQENNPTSPAGSRTCPRGIRRNFRPH
jgi:hypothetical protein